MEMSLAKERRRSHCRLQFPVLSPVAFVAVLRLPRQDDQPTHYTVRSSWQRKHRENNLREWVLEGSMDRQNWIQLDRLEYNNLLNDRNAMAIFPVANPEEVRMIRLQQT
jgi:hypothetical protein